MSEDEEKKALIIGISEYDNLKKLDFCRKDAEDLCQVLSDQNVQFKITIDNKLIGRIDWEMMRNALINFFRDPGIKSKDTLLFYFSGHGVLDNNGNNYFATSNIDPILPYDKGIPFDFLNTLLVDCKSNKIIIVLDCCYSGEASISKGENDEDENAKRGKQDMEKKIPKGEGKYLLASSQGFQKSYPMPDKPYSAFTYFLINGLRKNEESVDINGYVTPETLGKYIDNKINDLPGNRQKPIRKIEAQVMSFWRIIQNLQNQKKQ